MKGEETIHAYHGTLDPLSPRTREPFSKVSSLYIHIPFCATKCSYCDFFSVPFDGPLANAYTGALCKELQWRRDGAGSLRTIYIGGGTPSLLPEPCLNRLFSCLTDTFRISEDAEISVEANPGTLTEEKIDLLVSLGVNRMSVGIQSLNDGELKTLGRIHTADDAIRCLEMLEHAGLINVSVDLMYGIPGQSAESWHKTISVMVEYMPKHVSAYELTFEEGTPLSASAKKPHEEVILGMYDDTIDSLSGSGYKQYEIANFAQTAFQCRHNLNYWDRGEYIGAGAGAHSFFAGKRSMNVRSVRDYIGHLKGNRLPEAESTMISPAEAMKEFLFLGLRTTRGIDIAKAKNLGLDVTIAAKPLIETGCLAIEHGSLRCTRRGTAISNTVIVSLFENLGL